jgi:hypothetical protein
MEVGLAVKVTVGTGGGGGVLLPPPPQPFRKRPKNKAKPAAKADLEDDTLVLEKFPKAGIVAILPFKADYEGNVLRKNKWQLHAGGDRMREGD